MELLAAINLPPEEHDSAFLVGLFSLLDKLLGIPIDQALQLLALPRSVTDALIDGTGVLGKMLTLTVACEENDDDACARAAFDLNFDNHQINMAHMEALVWADNLVGSAK